MPICLRKKLSVLRNSSPGINLAIEALKGVNIDPSVPKVAVGFSMLDVDNNHHLRAKAYVENLKRRRPSVSH